MYLPIPHAVGRHEPARRYPSYQDSPSTASRKSEPRCMAQCVLRLAQRATAGPVTAPSAEEPLLFEACSAMVLECWRRGLKVSVPRGSRFEIEVPADAGHPLGDIVQSLHPSVQQWNQRLRDRRWQLVLAA